MINPSSDFEHAKCVGQDPVYWDPDAHDHKRLGGWKVCWMCEEAKDICMDCPAIQACYRFAIRTGENWMIRAGSEWERGRPLNRRRPRVNRALL